LFSTLTEDERENLAQEMKRLTFKQDVVIAAQDAALTSLMIVRSGVVVVEREIEGVMSEITRLAPGDLFGERGVLMGAVEPARMRALTFVVVYEISKEVLAGVMRDRPGLAEELGLLLTRRVESEIHLSNDLRQSADQHPTSITARIRHLFQVPHSGH
jgi:CRP-like cAMP-binding protein